MSTELSWRHLLPDTGRVILAHVTVSVHGVELLHQRLELPLQFILDGTKLQAVQLTINVITELPQMFLPLIFLSNTLDTSILLRRGLMSIFFIFIIIYVNLRKPIYLRSPRGLSSQKSFSAEISIFCPKGWYQVFIFRE